MAIAGIAMGAIQAGISASKASQLPDDQKYTVSPELQAAYAMSRRRADEGFSPEERAAFEQMLARQGTAARQMFQNVGLAGAGSAAANIMGVDALNQFAADGASIKRKNAGDFYGLAGQMQSVQDKETGRFNQQLNMESQALGQATQAGIGNMMGAAQSYQDFQTDQQAIAAYKEGGGGGGDSSKSEAPGFGDLLSFLNRSKSAPKYPPPIWQPPQMNTPFQGYGMDLYRPR